MSFSPLYTPTPLNDPLQNQGLGLAPQQQSSPNLSAQPAPPLSDPSSLIEQINGGLQTASQNFIPLSIPGVDSPNTQPSLITGLPTALTALQSKYTKAIPTLQQAISQGQVSQQSVNALAAYDQRRVLQGQSPLGPQQSAGALQTVTTGQAATPNPSHSAWDVFGNAGRDLKAIVGSIPHIPGQLVSEATHLGDIPSDIANAPNPITGLLQAHGIRLIPGAYTLGNLAEGGKGISELIHHPLMTGLDVAGLNAEVGSALATPEETAAAKLAGEHVPGGISRALTATGAAEPYAAFKSTIGDFLKQTRPGQWAEATFGTKARAMSLLVNNAAYQVRAAMDPSITGGASLIDPEGIATNIAKGTIENVKKWENVISPDRMGELTTQMQLNPDAIPNLADHERAFLDDQRTMTNQIANYHLGNGELEQLVTNGQMEVMQPSDAAEIRKQWTRRDRYESMTGVRQLVRNPNSITYDDIQAQLPAVQNALADDRFSGKYKTFIGKGYGYAIRNLGGTLPDGYMRALSNKDFAAATDLIANHIPEFDNPIKPGEINARERWTATTRAYTPGNYKRAISDAADAENTLPPRWREWRDQIVQGKVVSKLQAIGDSDHLDVPALIQHAMDRNYRQVADAGLFSADDLQRFNREAEQMIADMKQTAGESPIFVHRMEPEQVQSIKYGTEPVRGTLQGTVKVPTQLKSINDLATPYVHDVTVALSHEMSQVLTAKAQTYIYSELLRTDPAEGETLAPFARTAADLERQYAGVGENRLHINPTVDTQSIVKQRIGKEWVKFPIDKLPADLKLSLGLQDEMGEAHPYIPRSVYRNLAELDKPHTFGVFDSVMKVFRTALLPLSPRFLLYHMLGGAVQLAGQTDPFTVWSHLGNALEMVRDDKLPDTLRPVLGHVLDPALEWEFKSGGTIRRWLGDSPLAKVADASSNALDKVVGKSYGLVSFFQDTYRAMGYLYGYDKGITAGMTAEQAAAAGEALARKALMTWDDMTAIERTGMRSIFPFYGFARHILQYAERYPIDHPFRSAVIASIARNEMADLGTGLPQTMLNMLFLGHPDSHGHVRAINTAALNPFRDVANMTTLAGWLSATNPIISGVLQSAGLDTTSGGPDLYPNLHYDTETGRLAPISTNPLLNIAYQTLPQSQILGGLLSKSSEYKDLMRLDPSSAMRLIASQGGIPMTYRDLNVDRTMIQDEVTRETAQKAAFDDALKTGDWSEARRWPVLRPVLNQVQQLQQSGALSQFQPGGMNSDQKLQQVQQMIASSVG